MCGQYSTESSGIWDALSDHFVFATNDNTLLHQSCRTLKLLSNWLVLFYNFFALIFYNIVSTILSKCYSAPVPFILQLIKLKIKLLNFLCS